jgi:3-deoxy-D-manno-octulosonic-acid transferase
MLFFYLLSTLLSPFVRILVRYRVSKGLEEKGRVKERYGYTSHARPIGNLIWVHAASVGETISVIPVIKAYYSAYPNQAILLTTTTVTAGTIARQRLSDVCIHQYIPFDVGPWVDQFLDHWKPNLSVFIESELWPNLIQRTYHRKIPLILLNAKLSDKSYKRWLKFPWMAKFLLTRFSLCLAQSETTAERLKNLKASNVKTIANLKFAAEPLPYDEQKLAQLKHLFERRLLWVAASTHAGEEEIILKIHKNLQKEIPNLLTILVPRHPVRVDKIEKLCNDLELSSVRHSSFHEQSDFQIYLGDTIGELGLFYALSQIVFIGGSFVPIGGHNPIEPAMSECAVLWGPYVHDFRDVCKILSDSCYSVETPEKFEITLKYLLENPDQAISAGKSTAAIIKKQAESVQDIVATLRTYCTDE